MSSNYEISASDNDGTPRRRRSSQARPSTPGARDRLQVETDRQLERSRARESDASELMIFDHQTDVGVQSSTVADSGRSGAGRFTSESPGVQFSLDVDAMFAGSDSYESVILKRSLGASGIATPSVSTASPELSTPLESAPSTAPPYDLRSRSQTVQLQRHLPLQYPLHRPLSDLPICTRPTV
ncbi:hypothetical protein HDU93_009129 [Gonapodya sp. JEL0774]|nr:hypothetical protein HDU93_009129 [Gonapodya sp. JEL0774]